MSNVSIANTRSHERVPTAMPILLAGRIGVTRDISAEGIYLEVAGTGIQDGEVCFELDLGTAHRAMKMKCRGNVVRTEQNGDLIGVAVSISELQLLVK